ncbi:MAG: S8 family serine peptidase [Bdellovibrionales bacterium]|nr:S8 family serine peptidase [Bdellovibrionales bacterium]
MGEGSVADILIISSSRSYSDEQLGRLFTPGGSGYVAEDDDSIKKIETSFLGKTYPLVITSGGNGVNECTEEAYEIGKEVGLLPAGLLGKFNNDNSCESITTPACDKVRKFLKSCDMRMARIIKEDKSYKQNWIIVGSAGIDRVSDSADYLQGSYQLHQKPGSVLKDRWVSTYYRYKKDSEIFEGTSHGAPLVAKVAAEIKRRVSSGVDGWTNAHIAELILETADDIGASGTDNVYGRGALNIKKVFIELEKYLEDNEKPDLTP